MSRFHSDEHRRGDINLPNKSGKVDPRLPSAQRDRTFAEMQKFDRENRHLPHDEYWNKRLGGKNGADERRQRARKKAGR